MTSTLSNTARKIAVPAVLTSAADYRVKVTWLTNPRIFGWSSGFITLQQ